MSSTSYVALEEHYEQAEGIEPSSLLSTGKTESGVLSLISYWVFMHIDRFSPLNLLSLRLSNPISLCSNPLVNFVALFQNCSSRSRICNF